MDDPGSRRLVQVQALDGGAAHPYELRGTLGRGGMATVYRAHDPQLGRDVALKVLDGQLSEARRQRFLREGQTVAALSHVGVVPLLGAGVLDGRPCLVFRLVEGARSLTDAWRTLALPARIELLLQVAGAVAHAHAAGIVHRDLNPENVLVDGEGRAFVNDFGIALLSADTERLTQTGALLGSVRSMAPEQILGERKRLGPPVDVWALGVLLYLAIADRWPFDGASVTEVLSRVARAQPPSLARLVPDAPPALVAVCRRALEPDPEQRYPDAAAFRGALAEARGAGQPSPSRAWLAACLALVIVLGAAGAALALRADQGPGPPQPDAPATDARPPDTDAGEPRAPQPTTPEPALSPALEASVELTFPHEGTHSLTACDEAVWVGGPGYVLRYPRRGDAGFEAHARIELRGSAVEVASVKNTPWIYYAADGVVHVAALERGTLREVWSAPGLTRRGAALRAWREGDATRLLVVAEAEVRILTVDPSGALTGELALEVPVAWVRGAVSLPARGQVALCGNGGGRLGGFVGGYDAQSGALVWSVDVPGTAQGLAEAADGRLLFGVRETRTLDAADPTELGLRRVVLLQGTTAAAPYRDLLRVRGWVISLAAEHGTSAATLEVRDASSMESLCTELLWSAGSGKLCWDEAWGGVWVTTPAEAKLYRFARRRR